LDQGAERARLSSARGASDPGDGVRGRERSAGPRGLSRRGAGRGRVRDPVRLMLETLFDGAPATLPDALAARYGGGLAIAAPRVLLNFVSSVDGVVTLEPPGESGHIVSGGSAADRFVMALLRAFADVVLIGAETYRRAHESLWTSAAAFPEAADDFATLRRA